MAKTIDLYIDQGSDFKAVLPSVTDTTGTQVNLTGYSVAAQLRRSYSSQSAVSFTATITNAALGIITLTLDTTLTGGLAPLRYVYDVVMTDPDDFKTMIFSGLAIVNEGITGRPNTIVLNPDLADDWGTLEG